MAVDIDAAIIDSFEIEVNCGQLMRSVDLNEYRKIFERAIRLDQP